MENCGQWQQSSKQTGMFSSLSRSRSSSSVHHCQREISLVRAMPIKRKLFRYVNIMWVTVQKSKICVTQIQPRWAPLEGEKEREGQNLCHFWGRQCLAVMKEWNVVRLESESIAGFFLFPWLWISCFSCERFCWRIALLVKTGRSLQESWFSYTAAGMSECACLTGSR